MTRGGPGYVLVKATAGAGLGDRLRSVITGILYARKSGRQLVVAWDDGLYGPYGEDVFVRLFELTGLPSAEFDPRSDYTVRPDIWRGRLDQPMRELYQEYGSEKWDRRRARELFSFDQSCLDYPEDVLVMWEFDQFEKVCELERDRWRNEYGDTPESAMHAIVAANLRPVERIRSLVAQFRREYFRSPMIGIHVRRTAEQGSRDKGIAFEKYHHVIAKIRGRHPNAGLFLATDNAQVLKTFSERYGDLITLAKRLPAAGEALHLSAAREDRLQGASEAIADMLLLADCEFMVYPRWSSFSMIASMFSGAPGSRIVPLDDLTGPRSYLAFHKRLRALQRV